MAYNQALADRVREIIVMTHDEVEEKKMFGGLCFMVNDKMCIGVEKHRLMVRIDPSGYEEALEKDGVEPMNFTGKPMKGFIYVNADALGSTKKLDYWVQIALEYNKIAKASKKKTRSRS